MLGGFPLKVEVESVHWEDQNNAFSLLSGDTLTSSTNVISPHMSPSSGVNGGGVNGGGVNGGGVNGGSVNGGFNGGSVMALYDDRIRHQPVSRLISPVTQRWLSENYEIAEGCSVPRNVLYEHYLDFCVRNSVQPVNAASFGKIIRQHFPSLKTRRLGSRGQSKYHYYGLTIKDTSQYHMNDYTYKAPSSSPQQKPNNIVSPVKPLPSDVLASLLPDFPKIQQLQIPPQASSAHIAEFLERYQIYSHNVLEVIVRAAFSEVEALLLKFWGSFSDGAMASLDKFSDIVAYCDILLFKTIISLLLPTPLHPIPSSLTQTIRSFCKQYGGWSRMAVAGLSDNVVSSVLQASDLFVAMMRRQTTLTHIAQATRTVLSSSSAVSQMIHDWCHLDIDSMTHQAMFLFSCPGGNISSGVLKEVQSEFSELLGEQASVEEYSEWIKELVDKFVVKVRCLQPFNSIKELVDEFVVKKSDSPEKFKKFSQQFVTQWSYFISRIVRDLTLRSAPSFGSFHLLHMLFSDYVIHLVEEHQQTELQNKLWNAVSGENPAKYNQGSQSSHQRKTKQQPVNLSRPFPFVTEMTSFQNNVTPLQNNLTSFQNSVRSLENSALSQNNPLLNNHMMATTQATGQTLLASSSAKVTPSITEEAAKSVSTEAKLDREISVTDDLFEVTSSTQPMTSSSSGILSPILAEIASTDVSMVSPDVSMVSPDIDMESTASMLSSSQTNIFSISNGLSIGRLANRNLLQNSDMLTTQDLILNEGDTLSDNLMEEILKCVSNSNCL